MPFRQPEQRFGNCRVKTTKRVKVIALSFAASLLPWNKALAKPKVD